MTRQGISGWGAGARRAAVLLVALLAFFPVARWVPGNLELEGFDQLVAGWVRGTFLTAVAGLVLALLASGLGGWGEAITRLERRLAGATAGRVWLAALVGLTLGLYIWVGLDVFLGRPRYVDDLTQLFQAQTFASGRLWRPVLAPSAFHSAYLVAEYQGRVFGQFPPGWSAMMAVGELLRATWLLPPLCGAAAVAGFAVLLGAMGERPLVQVAGAGAFALSPWVMFNAASHMNHMPTVMWLVWGAALLVVEVRAEEVGQPGQRWRLAGSGFCLGMAGTIRPLDAAAFGVPALAWLGLEAARNRRARSLIVFGAGLAVPLVALAWYNAQTTGSPLRFGYDVLWGAAQGMGFHAAPWGPPHTPARAMALLNAYLIATQQNLFESPVPSLTAAFGTLLLVPRVKLVDRLLLACAALLMIGYFFYWHGGFYLGPRFYLPLAWIAVLWTVRLPVVLRDAGASPFAVRWTVMTMLAALVAAWGSSVPSRWREYRDTLPLRRLDPDLLAAQRGVTNALVFVPDTWGTEVRARLWALGITRTETDHLYRNTDLCVLDAGVRSLEDAGVRGNDALASLSPLMTDSTKLRPSTLSADTTERLLPGLEYSPRCLRRLTAERRGAWSLLPFLTARRGGNVFARDLHERNAALGLVSRDRPWYQLRHKAGAVDAVEFARLNPDSALFSWMREAALP